MRGKIADSVILSSMNLTIVAFVYGLPLGNLSPLLELVLASAVLPATFLFALAYTIRDLIKSGKRTQAALALLLLVPTAIFLRSVRLDL
jgi:hypothetical protein